MFEIARHPESAARAPSVSSDHTVRKRAGEPPAAAAPQTSPPPGGEARGDVLSRALARVVAARAHVARPSQAPRMLQRRVEFETRDDALVDAGYVLALINARKAVLPDERELAQLNVENVAAALARLRESAIDYGRFDLRHDQDVALLYYELRKHVNKPLTADPPGEVATSMKAAKAKKWALQDSRHKTGKAGWTYELALLGTGASIAYYVTSHKHEIDREQTIVIGKQQPWAKERGPGVINHPLHMISALRDEVGTSNEALADRGEFSKVVAQVIDKYVPIQRDATIKKVTKEQLGGEWFYRIDIDLGGALTYYARHVVAGLGIGGHALPTGRRQPAAKEGDPAPEPEKQTDFLEGHAMNMDEFQRRAEEIREGDAKRPDITVVITGPNAGIDAVKTSIECGFTIIWVTGSGRPGFLKGTDNEMVEDEYDNCMMGNPSAIKEVIQGYAYLATANPAQDGKPIVVDTGPANSPRPVAADYFVWAMGPSVAQIQSIFDEEQRKAFVLSYDTNRQFGAEGPAAVLGLQAPDASEAADRTSLQIIGGAAYRMAQNVPYTYVRDREKLAQEALQRMNGYEQDFIRTSIRLDNRNDVCAAMKLAREKAKQSLDAWASVPKKIEDAKTAEELPSSIAPLAVERELEIVGFLHPGKRFNDDDPERWAQRHWGAVREVHEYGRLLTAFNKEVGGYLAAVKAQVKPPPPDPRKAWGQMAKVIGTLPLNVAMNDQLTPSRSQVEAAAAFVPAYVRDDVNFATDSATVLQIYISLNYPNLSPHEVDMWVDRIIRWRRPSPEDREKYKLLWGPLPPPKDPAKSRENAERFGAWFKKRLGEENGRKAKSTL